MTVQEAATRLEWMCKSSLRPESAIIVRADVEAIRVILWERDRLAAEVERLKNRPSFEAAVAECSLARTSDRERRLEAEAGALRNGLALALRWAVHPKEIDPTLPCATDGEPERELAEARAALSADAGRRTLAQIEAGRALAEAARRVMNEEFTDACAEALATAIADWDRAAGEEGAK